MKKSIVYILLAALLMTALFSASCNRKIINDKEFEDIMDDLDYDINKYTSGLPKGMNRRINAYDSDDFFAFYVEFDDEKEAKEEYEDLLDDVMDAKDDKDFDGKIKKSGFGNYNKLIVNGDFDEEVNEFPEGNVYAVIYRIEDIILVVGATDNDKRDIKEVEEVLKELGY